jgi:Domain of unknown function (DUF5666)
MRRTILGRSLAVVTLVGWLVAPALAQDTKSARGSVTAMTGNSLSVKAGDRELKFTIDGKTVLTAEGAGTADRKAETAGKPGPKLSDFIKVGDAVEVSYHETGGTLHAANVRRISSAGAGGGGTTSTSESRTETANGTVESLSGSTLTITGSTSGGTFKQSFTIDGKTRVVAAGAGTAASAAGGKVSISDHVGVGDQVTVTYTSTGTTLHADEVRVRVKKK